MGRYLPRWGLLGVGGLLGWGDELAPVLRLHPSTHSVRRGTILKMLTKSRRAMRAIPLLSAESAGSYVILCRAEA